MPVIGFLDARSPECWESRLRGFRQGLKEVGYVEGENVTIEFRGADNQLDRLPDLAGRFGSPKGRRDRYGRRSCGLGGQGGNNDNPDCLPRGPRPGRAWFGHQPCPAGGQRHRYQFF